jgi:hypothetical protein
VARRIGLLIVGALVWTLLAMYPDPAVLFRNIARYRHLPLDPTIEKRMGWDLPDDPVGIEFIVDTLIIATPDWTIYRVPWYVPTAREAAVMTHGDCEAKSMLLASLLEGKHIPYEIRASFAHIWVDYPGRKARPGESEDIAYAEEKDGRFHFGWPKRVPWRDLLEVQREQLWEAMPLARKAIWLMGLAWVVMAVALLGGAAPEGDLVSQWRAPLRSYAVSAFWLSCLMLVAIALAQTRIGRGEPVRWQLADVYETFALSVLSGPLLAWLQLVRPRRAVSIAPDEPRLRRASRFGMWQRTSALSTSDVDHFELAASPGGLRAWVVSAALRAGQRVPLLRHSRETAARAALRRLGLELARPVVVRAEGREYWTAPDEIGLSLKERAGRRPGQELKPRPDDCLLVEEQIEGAWALGYPRQGRGASRPLLLLVGLVAGTVIGATALLVLLPGSMVVRVIWVGVAVLMGMTVYGGMSLREEILATLAGTRVQVADGELSFHNPDGKVESVALDHVESVEIGRKGETPTIAVVSAERVLHLRLYPQPKHLEWVRSAIEGAISGAGF